MRFSGRLSGHAAPEVIERVDSAELRVVRGSTASAIAMGHCFASRPALEECLRDFVSTGSAKCFSGWPGCYSVAVLQPRCVTLIADPVGQFPLYLARVGADVMFGSSAAALAAIVHAIPDQITLLATLTCPEAHGLLGTRSVFDGIERLPEGHVARLANGRVDVEPCLEFQADSRISFADAAAILRLSLTRAVDSRVTSAKSLTADLSGGIDSTSLAFLARRKSARLPVFTYVNNNRPVVDDVDQAVRAVKLDTGLDHHLVAGSDDDLPYRSIDVVDDEPHSSAVATGSMKARLNAAAKLGSDLHLVGEGGDVVLTAPAAYLADLKGQRLWRHCLGWARMRNRSPLAVLARTRAVSGQNLREAFADLADGIARGRAPGELSWEEDNIGYWTVPRADWLTGPARRTLAEYVHGHAAGLGETDGKPVGDFVTSARLRSQARTQ
ncbi:asparagine synthase-related protein, partial [Kibdelosporangium lantanae]